MEAGEDTMGKYWVWLLTAWLLVLPVAGFTATNQNLQLTVMLSDLDPAWVNAFDTRQWVAENAWGNDFTADLRYVSYSGRRALRAGFALKPSPTGKNWAFLHTDFFSPEAWNSAPAVSQITLDVFFTAPGNRSLDIELKAGDGSTLQKKTVSNIVPGAWRTLSFSLDALTGSVSQIYLVPGALADGDALYLSNLQIVRSGSEMWEPFTAPGYAWLGQEDFQPWTALGRNEPITHSWTYGGSAGALYIPWTASLNASGTAKMETTNLNHLNFSGIQNFRAQVRSSRANQPIFMAFWDGTKWTPSASLAVTSANVWEQKSWAPPSGVDWGNLQSFMFMVDTTAGGTGEVWIDALEFVLP